MTPRLAICFPAAPTPNGFEMVRRSVMALRAQDCDPGLFEVVVAIDGGDPFAAREAIRAQPFSLTVVQSRRTAGNEDIPHRNHARNAAWKAATAHLCWMLDADFILPPNAVRHVLAEHDAAMERNAPAVLSPCLKQFGGATTEEWWQRSATWADSGDPQAFRDLIATWPEWGPVFSGFPEMATDGAHPASVSVGDRMQEGMPILWRGFLEATGGFDEGYVGWGGDKIALIDVLRGLCREGMIDMRLVTSVTALHQPHPTDPAAGNPRSNANERRRWGDRMPIQSRTLEWKRRLPVLTEALHRGWAGCGATPSVPALSALAPLLDAMAPLAKRAAKGGAFVACMGPHAGVLRSYMERAGLPVRAASKDTACVAVMIDPIEGGDVAGLGARLRAELHPGGTVIIAQRLDFEGVPPIQSSHLQTQVIRRSMDARVVKIAGVRYTVICGRL